MIPRTIPAVQGHSWQQELTQMITDPAELVARLQLEHILGEKALAAAASFPLRVTESFVSRMRPGDVKDPLLLQALPLILELDSLQTPETPTEWLRDPLAEQGFKHAPGLIHKYKSRVLLIASPQCAINCRYCFRRHFDYADNSPGREEWQKAFSYIAADNSIEEVILSGGDPLTVADKQLQWFINSIENIEHVKRIRIHTRIPVVLPSRITERLLKILSNANQQIIFVVHINHPNEIDTDVAEKLRGLKNSVDALFNQSVLLNNVNNNINTLSNLSKKLFSCGVVPYYLHLLDKVQGAAHFDVARKEAIQLSQKLRAELPGYMVPLLVEEIPGADSKTPIICHTG